MLHALFLLKVSDHVSLPQPFILNYLLAAAALG